MTTCAANGGCVAGLRSIGSGWAAIDKHVCARRSLGRDWVAIDRHVCARRSLGLSWSSDDEGVGARRSIGVNGSSDDVRAGARRSPGAKAAGLAGRSPLKGLNCIDGGCAEHPEATAKRVCGRGKDVDRWASGSPCSTVLLSPFSGLRPASPAALAPGERRAHTCLSMATQLHPGVRRPATPSSSDDQLNPGERRAHTYLSMATQSHLGVRRPAAPSSSDDQLTLGVRCPATPSSSAAIVPTRPTEHLPA
jgi:hypothetical protein